MHIPLPEDHAGFLHAMEVRLKHPRVTSLRELVLYIHASKYDEASKELVHDLGFLIPEVIIRYAEDY